MNAKELAALISGRGYPFEMTKEEERAAAAAGLVVAFGDSDDRLEFLGAINEEFGAWRGTTVYLDGDGLIKNECEEENCPYYEKAKKGAVELTSVWCNGHKDHDPHGGPAWTIKTDIPHQTFDIREDDEIQSRGIVFAMADLKTAWLARQ